MARICGEACNHCIYIGEGDFICALANELVIVDWVPVYACCIKKKKNLINFQEKKKKIKKGILK